MVVPLHRTIGLNVSFACVFLWYAIDQITVRGSDSFTWGVYRKTPSLYLVSLNHQGCNKYGIILVLDL